MFPPKISTNLDNPSLALTKVQTYEMSENHHIQGQRKVCSKQLHGSFTIFLLDFKAVQETLEMRDME